MCTTVNVMYHTLIYFWSIQKPYHECASLRDCKTYENKEIEKIVTRWAKKKQGFGLKMMQ